VRTDYGGEVVGRASYWFVTSVTSGGVTIIDSDFQVVSMEQNLALTITNQDDQLYRNHGNPVIIATNPSPTQTLINNNDKLHSYISSNCTLL